MAIAHPPCLASFVVVALVKPSASSSGYSGSCGAGPTLVSLYQGPSSSTLLLPALDIRTHQAQHLRTSSLTKAACLITALPSHQHLGPTPDSHANDLPAI